MTQVLLGGIALVLSIIAIMASSSSKLDRDVIAPLRYGGIIVLFLSIIILVTSTFVMIPAGHKGVVTMFGEVKTEVLPEGFNMVNPLASVYEVSARVEREEQTHTAETSDTQSVTVSVVINWRPDGNELAKLYKNYGKNYYEKIIPPASKEAIKAEVAKYKVTDLIAKRPQIHKNVKEYINNWLQKYGLEVLEVGIGDVDFSDKYDAAIEAKQVQEQQALQKEYELQKVETEAKMAAAVAKGEADSQIARALGQAESVKLEAQAQADALRIRGEAQAEYNKRVAESLSPLLIQSDYLKKWDGRLPAYMLGDSSNTMLMLPTSK